MKRYYGPMIIGYVMVLIYLMFFGLGRSVEGYFSPQLVPGQTLKYYLLHESNFLVSFHNLANNVLAFMPFGFLGLLYPSLQSYSKLLVTFVLGISFIEFLQWYSQLGFADVDDVLLNTLGMSMGFVAFKVMQERRYHQAYMQKITYDLQIIWNEPLNPRAHLKR